jgi:hypothetical protein
MKCTIRGDREKIEHLTDPSKYDDFTPRLVGFLDVRKDLTDFYGWVPFDILPHICQLLHVGGIKYLNLHGTVLYRRKADIHNIGFQKEFNLDEYV